MASPAFLAGHWDKQIRLGILHPGKLVDGLREAACKRGVSLYENSPLTQLAAADSGSDILLTSAHGQIRARKVFLATHAYPSLIPQTRRSLMAPIGSTHWLPHLLRWLGANITFSALEKADRNQGKKGLWLKMLDRIGFGIKI